MEPMLRNGNYIILFNELSEVGDRAIKPSDIEATDTNRALGHQFITDY